MTDDDSVFDKLPMELLVRIFHHTRADSVLNGCGIKYPHPVALTLGHVCRHWRNVALGAPTLWTDIRIVQYDTKDIREAARVYLERSKACPIFLSWFPGPDQSYTNIQRVINDLIIPGVGRWQRITLLAKNYKAIDALLAAMKYLDFPILQDVEISCMLVKLSSSNPTFRPSAPLLRRCRFRNVLSLPPLPSNLVVLDYVFSVAGRTRFDLDPLLEFLPYVAHSLEHLRFGTPPGCKFRFTPRTFRIPLEHLKSLLIKGSSVIMDHIFATNLTYFTVSPPHDAMDAAGMFEGFSVPTLRSIQFHDGPLLPILNAHDFPSIFPQLESITLSGCTDELAFARLLEPFEPKKPTSSQDALKVQNPFPNLKEFTISDMRIWTSLQTAIEKRLENGDKSLRKIRLPKVGATDVVMSSLRKFELPGIDTTKVVMLYPRRWLPAQGIELVLYESGRVPISTPEFQDDFCDDETRLLLEMVKKIR